MDAAKRDGPFDKVHAENAGLNQDMRKGSTEVKMLVRLMDEATVDPLAICMCRRNGTDVSTIVDHEAFSRITLMNVKHTASSRITRRQLHNQCLVSAFPEKEQGERRHLLFLVTAVVVVVVVV